MILRRLDQIICFFAVMACERQHQPVLEPDIYQGYNVHAEESILAESPNFKLMGYVDQEFAAELLEDLEIFRQVLFETNNILLKDNFPKLEILFVDQSDIYGAFIVGEFSIAHYSKSLNGSKVVVNFNDFGRLSENIRRTLFHEYVHYFNDFHLDYNTPLWLNEGSAEYFASFQNVGDDGEYGFGYEEAGYINYLGHKKTQWLSSEQFLENLKDYPIIPGYFGEAAQQRQSAYYAQSWLLYHWLQTTDKGELAKQKLIQALNSGGDVQKSFPEDMEAVLKAHLETAMFKNLAKTIHLDLDPVDISIISISRDELLSRVLFQLYLDPGSESRVPVVARLFNEIKDGIEDNPYVGVLASIGLCEEGLTAYGQAGLVQAFDQTEEYEIRRAAAMTYLLCATQKRKDHMIRSLQLVEETKSEGVTDPDLDFQYLTYRERYGASGSEKVMLQNIFDSAHHKRRPIQALGLVQVLLTLGDYNEADAILKRAALWNNDDVVAERRISLLRTEVDGYLQSGDE